MKGASVDLIIERLNTGFYNKYTNPLRIVFQLLIHIDDDAVTTYRVEKKLEEKIKYFVDNEIIIYKDIVSQIKKLDKEFLKELKDYLPISSQNIYIQYILDLINGEISEKIIETPEEIELDIEILLSELFIYLYNERRFNNKKGKNDVILDAVINDNLHLFQAFINNNEINLLGRNYYNDSWLHLAAAHNSIQILKYLLQLGLDINIQNDFKHTPVFTAYINKQIESFQYLIDNGANVTIKNNENLTLTETVIIDNNVDVLHYILNKRKLGDNGINYDPYIIALNFKAYSVYHYLNSINYPMKAKIEAVFLTACKDGQIDIISTFLTQGLSINLNYKKMTPLLSTIEGNQIEATKYLLTNGANPNPKSYSPLLYAISQGKIEFVKILIEYGANPHKQNRKFLTPLMMAVFYGHLDIVKYLIELGVDINQVGVNKLTPLAVAAEVGNCEIAAYLIDHGATILPKTVSPLTKTIKYGHIEFLKLLLNKGFCLDKTKLKFFDLDRLLKQSKRYKTPYLKQILTLELTDQNNVRVCDFMIRAYKKYLRIMFTLGLVFLLLLILCISISMLSFNDYIYYVKDVGRETALITQLDSQQHEVYYTYNVNNVIIKSSSVVNQNTFNKLNLGDDIEIIYKIHNVKDSILAKQLSYLLNELVILSTVSLFILLLSLIYLYTCIKERKYILNLLKS